MKRVSYVARCAFTFVEAMVLLAIFAILLFWFLPNLYQSKLRAQRLNCVYGQKGILLAFKQWALDQSNNYPMQVSVTNGGTMEWVSSGMVWPHLQVMSNELNTAKVLVCPADATRVAASPFTNQMPVSYFLGVNATKEQPQAFLTGDSNLLLDGTNVSPGLIALGTNLPLAWSAKMHRNQGNVGLADGSVQGLTMSRLREALQNSGDATNRIAVPSP